MRKFAVGFYDFQNERECVAEISAAPSFSRAQRTDELGLAVVKQTLSGRLNVPEAWNEFNVNN